MSLKIALDHIIIDKYCINKLIDSCDIMFMHENVYENKGIAKSTTHFLEKKNFTHKNTEFVKDLGEVI